MFDRWEASYGCLRCQRAELPGYRRVFGKKSVGNWGTSERPGLTLTLEKFDAGTCQGVAFEFPEHGNYTRSALKYLSKREACAPRMLPVRLSARRIVQARVYMYAGKNVIDPQTGLRQRAALVVSASGTSGTCFDYVRQTFEDLARIGIDDPEVTALWNAVRDVKAQAGIAGSNDKIEVVT